jgi:enhancing lycopene biosynthesis protein 2
MKKFAIILSGCGVYDGAEIHEAVMTMLAASKLGVMYQLYAPDIEQMHVINHLNGEVMDQKRNVLVESARIARGNIMPLVDLRVANYDGIIFPGGFGVAKNLCSFAVDGTEFSVLPEVERVVNEAHHVGKPIGALCISPVMISKIIRGATVTIGRDQATADAVKTLGGNHVETDHTGIVIDEQNKIVTTPCYMLDSSIAQIAQGAESLLRAMISL